MIQHFAARPNFPSTRPPRSIQHRLKYAKNPSAVVMIAIRGVAAKVGRRYYGSRETAEGGESMEASGELKMLLPQGQTTCLVRLALV